MKKTTLFSRMPKQNRTVRFSIGKRKTIIEIISAIFVLLFLYTGLSKWADYANFRTQLWLSPLLKDYATPAAWGIIISELLISLALFVSRLRLMGLYGSFILMSVFTIYIGYMLVFESKLPCHCGGVISKMTWPQHLAFNIFFTGLAFIGIRLSKLKTEEGIGLDSHEVIFT